MFKYQPLAKGDFRLLTILDDGGLDFSIETYEIKKPPRYIALSYRWDPAPYQKGRPKDRACYITVDGQRMQTSHNLHDALCHIGSDVRRAECMLWVDAICINQADADEKSHQVPSMKNIYEGSAGVYGWLGVPFDDEKTRLAVKLMRDLDSWLTESFKNNDHDPGVVLRTVTVGHPAYPSDHTGTTWKAWCGIAEMFDREYWRRTWVRQEITTPKSIRFYCGNHQFDDLLLFVTDFFVEMFSELSELDQHFRKLIDLTNYARDASGDRLNRAGGQSQTLLTLLNKAKSTECTDPKDKVYAVVAHAVDVTSGQYTVDYCLDVAQVYTNVVRFALDHLKESGLEFLGLVWHPAPESSNPAMRQVLNPMLPSWVPDWRRNATKASLADRNKATVNGMPLYNPCPNTNVEAKIHDPGLELEVKGFVQEDLVVASMTDIWEELDMFPSGPRAWYKDMMDSGTIELDEPIRRSLVGDRSGAERRTEGNNFQRAWQRGGALDWALFGRDKQEFDKPTMYRYYDQNMDLTDIAYQRRMGKTSGGQIAILPAAARLGDQVAAFHGGYCLYLVRSIPGRQNAYHFIGECYVDGLMDGAFLEGASDSDKVAKHIRLV